MTAKIHLFPLHRNNARLRNIAEPMIGATPEVAKKHLMDFLGWEWDRLEALGVDCGEIEIHVHQLAHALWACAFNKAHTA